MNLFQKDKDETLNHNIRLTRPNEFGSMTARKDDSSPSKSIFCHKRP